MIARPVRLGNSSAPPPLHAAQEQQRHTLSSPHNTRTRSVSANANGRSLPLRQASDGIASSSMMPLSHTPPRPSTHVFGGGGLGHSPAGVLSSPALSNTDGFFGRESRADSIGTLWSSADVPLILDGHRGSGSEAGGSTTLSSSSRALSQHGRPSSRGLSAAASGAGSSASQHAPGAAVTDEWDTSELLMSDDGQPFTPVRIAKRPPLKATTSGGWKVTDEKADGADKVARLQQPGSRPGTSSGTEATPPSQKKRPTRLHLASSSFDSTNARGIAGTQRMQAYDVPESVSQASRLTTSTIMPPASDSLQTVLFSATTPTRSTPPRPQAMHSPKTSTSTGGMPSSDLYRYAERFFDSSYSMASPSATTLAPVKSQSPDLARSSRFSDDSHATALTVDDTTSSSNEHAPAYAHSHTSNSSGSSSSPRLGLLRECATPQFPTSGGARLQPRIVTTDRVIQEDMRQPLTPLTMAMTLAKPPASLCTVTPTPSAISTPVLGPRRPSTTDAAVSPTKASATGAPGRSLRARHAHTSSDHDVLRRLKAEGGAGSKVDERLAFLHAPDATAAAAVLPPSPKRGALFGLRIRAVSTPRLRQPSRGALCSQDGVAAGVSAATAAIAAYERDSRPTSSRAQHPPRAPSGRFRAPATADADAELERSHSNTSSVSLHDAATQSSTSFVGRFRRPSSSEALAAAARRFRRPSRNGSNSSLAGGESQRAGSNASSTYVQQSANLLHHTASNASLQSTHASSAAVQPRRSKVGTPTSATRPKTKGGWATHLAHGLTLHIEHNGKKSAHRMNYQYYDPFGRPESLCRDMGRVGRASDAGVPSSFALMASGQAAQRSRNGSVSTTNGDGGDWPMDQAMGVLEFTAPEQGDDAATHLVVTSASSTSVVLKHLTIGDDTRADLITRQADLSLATAGTQEVGGSERKGKVSWRFVFAVEKEEGGGVADAKVVLRPLRFSCSTTLLDPARARKSRVLNLIKKQIGNHLESHSVDTTHSSNEEGDEREEEGANVGFDGLALPSPLPQHAPSPQRTVHDAPLSPRSLPRSRDGMRLVADEQRRPSSASQRAQGTLHAPPLASPTRLRSAAGSRAGSGQGNLLSLRNGSMASVMTNSSVASATWSPASRPGLLPFKVKRPFVDALRDAGRISNASEHGAFVNAHQECALAGGAGAATSPMMTSGSLSSPQTSVDSSPSPRKSLHELRGSIPSAGQQQRHAKLQQHQQQQQQHHARHVSGPAPSTALGLDTQSDGRLATSGNVRARVVSSFQAEEWDDGSAVQWASSQSRTRVRRMRTATEGVTQPTVEQPRRSSSSRPPTASEEIKASYLNSLSASRALPSVPKQSHSGHHGHSHSFVHAAHDDAPLPPRRLTSASIYGPPRPLQQQTQPSVYAYGQAPASPQYLKRLPAAPPGRRMPHHEAPEGQYWL